MKPAILTRLQKKAVSDSFNEIEKPTFSSRNSSFGWLDTTIFPFCAATASCLQQCLPVVHNFDLIKWQTIIRELKRLKTALAFGRPCNNQENSISILVFTDAGRPSDSAQLSTICVTNYRHISFCTTIEPTTRPSTHRNIH